MPVILETNHGRYTLASNPGDTLGGVLRSAGIPLSAVWTYYLEDHVEVAESSAARRVRFVPSQTSLTDPAISGRTVYARITRNINAPALLGFETTSTRQLENPSTEWTFPGTTDGAFGRVVAQLSPDDCLEVVRDSVSQVLTAWPLPGPPRFVVGTSGGGDSNILLSALLSSGLVEAGDVFPAMMLGIPDWDTQAGNARQLCESLGVDLKLISKEEAAELAGLTDLDTVTDAFKQRYPDADLEFLGTWLLRRVLSGYARTVGAPAVAFGANREDLISDGIARLSRGLPPLPTPYRPIGDCLVMYPMYRVPKKIGDGAYPTYSLENYEARNPSFSAGRSLFYYLAYCLSDIVPGIDVTLLDGFEKLAARSPDPYDLEDGEVFVADSYTPEQHAQWREFLDTVRRAPSSDTAGD